MHNLIRIGRSILIACILVTLVSCDFPPIPPVKVQFQVQQDVLAVLNNALQTLNQQPGQWNSVLTSAIAGLNQLSTDVASKFGQQATAIITKTLQDVQGLYNGVLGQTQATAFCTVDFVGRRIAEQIQGLIATLSSRPPPVLKPVVCATNPSTPIEAQSPVPITVYGYNFLAASAAHGFTVDLINDQGRILHRGIGGVAVKSDYELTISLRNTAFVGVDPNSLPQVALRWNEQATPGTGGQSAIAVHFPPQVDTAKAERERKKQQQEEQLRQLKEAQLKEHDRIAQQLKETQLKEQQALRSASVTFFTNDDDRDHDTLLTVTLLGPENQVVTESRQITEGFPDHSHSTPYSLSGPGCTKDQWRNCALRIEIQPNGHDTWRFNLRITFMFGDNVPIELDSAPQQMDQDHRLLTIRLVDMRTGSV